MTWAHGVSGYQNHKCRCQICRISWNSYHRRYVQARKARTGERYINGRFVPAKADAP